VQHGWRNVVADSAQVSKGPVNPAEYRINPGLPGACCWFFGELKSYAWYSRAILVHKAKGDRRSLIQIRLSDRRIRAVEAAKQAVKSGL
jgi:hypothetical protein